MNSENGIRNGFTDVAQKTGLFLAATAVSPFSGALGGLQGGFEKANKAGAEKVHVTKATVNKAPPHYKPIAALAGAGAVVGASTMGALEGTVTGVASAVANTYHIFMK